MKLVMYGCGVDENSKYKVISLQKFSGKFFHLFDDLLVNIKFSFILV